MIHIASDVITEIVILIMLLFMIQQSCKFSINFIMYFLLIHTSDETLYLQVFFKLKYDFTIICIIGNNTI